MTRSVIPGHATNVRGVAVSNARRQVDVTPGGMVSPRHYRSAEWGIRFGSRHYPDYAAPHPVAWNGEHGGRFLTADDAEELAEALQAAARWARAQNTFYI